MTKKLIKDINKTKSTIFITYILTYITVLTFLIGGIAMTNIEFTFFDIVVGFIALITTILCATGSFCISCKEEPKLLMKMKIAVVIISILTVGIGRQLEYSFNIFKRFGGNFLFFIYISIVTAIICAYLFTRDIYE